MTGVPDTGSVGPAMRGSARPRSRQILVAAMLASVLLHGLAVLAIFTVSQQRQAAQVAPPPPENVPIEVDVLADPRAGTVAAAEAEPVPEPDQQPEAPSEQAAVPTDPVPPEPPAPPAEPQRAEPEELPLPPPPPPPPPRVAAPAPRLPPARVRAGAADEGRDDGTTDIILGTNTIPPGDDPRAQNIPPRYPLDAARRGQQGAVELRVTVGTDGTALAVDVAVSSGYPLLDRAARDAVAKWRFRPGRENGIAMPTTIPVTLHFSLVDRQ